MSYDLMVFRKEHTPNTRKEFLNWYREQTKWGEDHSYDDPAITSPELRSWFLEMIQTFPAMNGPYAIHNDDDDDNDHITGYSIAKGCIYTDFRWSVAEEAYNTSLKLAKKHGVGFYDVSSDEGDILFPENGELKSIGKDDISETDFDSYEVTTYSRRPWWKFWQRSRIDKVRRKGHL
jgi:hypothetical protein